MDSLLPIGVPACCWMLHCMALVGHVWHPTPPTLAIDPPRAHQHLGGGLGLVGGCPVATRAPGLIQSRNGLSCNSMEAPKFWPRWWPGVPLPVHGHHPPALHIGLTKLGALACGAPNPATPQRQPHGHPPTTCTTNTNFSFGKPLCVLVGACCGLLWVAMWLPLGGVVAHMPLILSNQCAGLGGGAHAAMQCTPDHACPYPKFWCFHTIAEPIVF